MSERLKAVVSKYLILNGTADGVANIANSVGCAEQTIRRWIRVGPPTAHDDYLLALACGCSEEEALEIASKCPSAVAMKA